MGLDLSCLAGCWYPVLPLAAHLCHLPAVLCFAVTRSLLLTCLMPVGLLALRYYYSRKVILAYLECALHTDMADIEQYYMKPPGESWDSPTLLRSVLCPSATLVPGSGTGGLGLGRS